MKSYDIEIEEIWGGTVVRATDSTGTEHRFWFDQTDKGRTVMCAYIVFIPETGFRDYVPMTDWSIPAVVKEELNHHGLDTEPIYDTKGREL